MNITARATLRQIIDAAPPIKPVAAAHAEAARISAAVRDLGPARDALATAVHAALQRGDDPAADPEVVRILTATTIANEGIGQGVDSITFGLFREVCHAHADEIVTGWREPFTAAADALTAAHHQLGDVALEDSDTILAKGGDAAVSWTEARKASAVIDRIALGWAALGEFTLLADRDPRYRALYFTAPTPEQWLAHQLERRKLTPWDALRAGLELSLPSFAEYHQRIRVIQDAAANALAEAEQRNTDAMTGRRPVRLPT